MMFVKICGVTCEEDALLAVAMGADAVGFIFAPSPRQMSPEAVAAITRRLPPEVLSVGVFRNAMPARVVEIVYEAGLRAVQLHGSETKDDCMEISEEVPFVIKAFAAGSDALANVADYKVHAVLLDAPEPGRGELFDWRLADAVPQTKRLILAGGLRPSNVARAIDRVRPWGVDVSSGVETAPGVKDPRLVRAFVQAAKAAGKAIETSDTTYQSSNSWEISNLGFGGAGSNFGPSRDLGNDGIDWRSGPYDWQQD